MTEQESKWVSVRRKELYQLYELALMGPGLETETTQEELAALEHIRLVLMNASEQ